MELMDGNLMHLHASTGGAHGAYVYLFALANLLLAPNFWIYMYALGGDIYILLDIYVCIRWIYVYIVGYVFTLMQISMRALDLARWKTEEKE